MVEPISNDKMNALSLLIQHGSTYKRRAEKMLMEIAEGKVGKKKKKK